MPASWTGLVLYWSDMSFMPESLAVFLWVLMGWLKTIFFHHLNPFFSTWKLYCRKERTWSTGWSCLSCGHRWLRREGGGCIRRLWIPNYPAVPTYRPYLPTLSTVFFSQFSGIFVVHWSSSSRAGNSRLTDGSDRRWDHTVWLFHKTRSMIPYYPAELTNFFIHVVKMARPDL